MTHESLSLISSLILAYLLGSIPFGLILTKMAGLGDIRSIGSGNIGATNVLRTGHKSIAALTLLLDGAKGSVAVLLVRFLVADHYAAFAAILGLNLAVIGHCFPIWLKFKGGKGVATFLGSWLALNWPLGLAICGIWLLVALIFRMSSLASLTASLASIILWYFYGFDAMTGSLAATAVPIAVLWWRHRQNLSRLIKGEEAKIKFGKKTV